ncbi:MAG: hypothetical protein RIS03_654, partial [Pseudomonadota bacterium]
MNSRLIQRILILVCATSLAACASLQESAEWTNENYSGPKQTGKARKAPRVNIDKQSVTGMQAPYEDLWDRIRDGLVLQEPETPLVIKHVRWYADRPDYVDRMMSRSSRYLFYIVEEVERRKMPMELAL